MKNFTKKSILQKTIIAILVALLLSNFIVPTYSHADVGGVLLSPIVDLLCSVGDAVINLLQVCMTGSFGSKNLNFSFNTFMVEDDVFFANENGLYTDFIGEGSDASYTETIEIDKKDSKGNNIGFEKGWLGMSNKYHIPIATYSPEQIFAGNVAGLDINFINPNKYEGQNESSASKLQPTIATWYVALRNLTVVGLLSVLVYVGIRIIISSTASDKAKYKQMLVDWLVALCLVFFLHYIMSFVITMTESICNAIAGDGQTNIYVNVVSTDNESGTFKTNLLGLARFKTQYADFGQKMAYLIMYLALVIYTVIFTWFYLKRLLMMAFLTLIAPVVALTYPIDKMNDGKAQAFDSWLKEYVFNALIQPFHLIIYTVFVGSAMDLASTNIIYMIAALAFILPAEKILRKFFGFEKAGAGTLGALAGGAALASMAKKGMGMLGGGKKGSRPAGGGNSGSEDGSKPLRFESNHDISQIEDGDNSKFYQGEYNEEASLEAHRDNNEVAMKKYEEEGNQEEVDAARRRRDEANQRLEEIRKNKEEQNNQQTQQQATDKKKNNAFMNWANAHNINKRSIGKAAYRGIKGVAKFGTKTAFKAGAGTLAGAVALASGAGFAGASAAFMAGSNVGGKIGDAAVNLGTHVGHGAARVGRALYADATAANGEEGLIAAQNALLGGTRLGRELDLAHGDKRYQEAGEMQEFKTNKDNLQYLRDQIAAQNGGNVPSAKEVRDKMNSLDPYISEGLTDIKDMLKAQKAEEYVSSQKQAAIIAAIGKERGITADILNDDKKAKAQEANLRQDFMNKGYSQAQATKQANYTMNVLKVQNGVAHNLQKIDKSEKPRTKK